MEINLSCKLIQKTSEKSGKSYFCIEIPITNTYKKCVFLDNAEIELIQLLYAKKQ